MSGIHLAVLGANFGSIIPIDYLVVAGGGSGLGGDNFGGGGGAGGVRTASNYEIATGKTYTVTVGGGGAGVTNGGGAAGNAGQNSIFGNITATGGAGGSGILILKHA